MKSRRRINKVDRKLIKAGKKRIVISNLFKGKVRGKRYTVTVD